MSNLDTYNDYNPNAPWNQEETEPETDDNNLEYKLQNQIRATQYHVANLKKLAQIEVDFKTFGHLTYEQQTEKDNILNQYKN